MQGNEEGSSDVAKDGLLHERIFMNLTFKELDPIESITEEVEFQDVVLAAPVYQVVPYIREEYIVPNVKPNAYVMNTLLVTNMEHNTRVELYPPVNYTIQRLCGYPLFLEEGMCEIGDEVSLCTKSWAAVIFGLMVGLLAVTIISVNSLILGLVATNAATRKQHHAIKASMAVADGIVGFILLCTVLPAMAWVPGVKLEEFVSYSSDTVNSPIAILFGALLTVSLLGSIFHLLLLSIERFAVIKWPFWNRKRKTRSLVHSLLALWVVVITVSIVPAAFPKHFALQFQPLLLTYTMTLQSFPAWRGILYGAVAIFVPYTAMVCLCIATAIDISQKMKKTRKLFDSDHEQTSVTQQNPSKANIRQEIPVFVTLAMMITAFTVTLLPFMIVVAFRTSGYLNCRNLEGYYVTAYYVGLLNNLANGVIYNFRDGRFRKAAKKLLCGK